MKTNTIISNPIKSIKTDLIDFSKIKKQDHTIPKGYYSTQQLAKMFNISTQTVQRRIKHFWGLGEVKILFNTEKSILNHNRKIPYYKIDLNNFR